MACSQQIEAHVGDIMEARNKMREAEAPGLTKLQRLDLLGDANDLICATIRTLGRLECLIDILDECHIQFLEACK